MELTAKKVNDVFMDCLFKNEEIVGGKPIVEPVAVQGIISNFGFHPDRIKNHKDEIVELLNELPDSFHEGRGGGWSFLNACDNKQGKQWGEHKDIEQLFALGKAIDKIEYLMPKDMWKLFPGGMPYIMVKK